MNEKRYNIEIVYDETPINPREWDNITYLVGKPHYLDGHHAPPQDDILYTWPLYRYQHGGTALSMNSFASTWDSGLIGRVIILKSQLLKLGTTERDRETLQQWAANELKELEAWLNGNVYGYVITDKVDHEIVESCYGFYGDYGREEAQREAQAIVENLVARDREHEARINALVTIQEAHNLIRL
jgi:hypothetical protein